MIYGYHRNQVKNQRLDIGKHAIEAFCKDNGYDLEKIYTDYVIDKNYDFPCYAMLKEEVLQAGDILIITELERLGCNKRDIPEELQYFKDKGIRLMILELPATTQDLSALDASVAYMITETINNMLIEMYSSMVLAGIEKKNKGQQEGFAAKKARGEWEDYGRPRVQKPSNWDYVISQWKKGNITAVEAMEQTNLKKTTFYKLLKE